MDSLLYMASEGSLQKTNLSVAVKVKGQEIGDVDDTFQRGISPLSLPGTVYDWSRLAADRFLSLIEP